MTAPGCAEDAFGPTSEQIERDSFGSPEALSVIAAALPLVQAPASLESRIFEVVHQRGRLARFGAQVSELLDLTEHDALAALDALDDPGHWTEGFMAGMSLAPARCGHRIRHKLATFVRLVAGVTFPEHEHLGEERVLVLQGSCIDHGQIIRAGACSVMPAHSKHDFEVRAGPDMLFLVVIDHGIRIGDRILTSGGPESTRLRG